MNHETALKNAKKAISQILQGKVGRFYVAKTEGRNPDWLFVTAGAKDTAAESALAAAVKGADGLGKHKPACGVVTAEGGKIRFEMGKVKSFKSKIGAGQLKNTLKDLKKNKGMSFLGKVTISSGTEDGGEPEVFEGGELTEAELIGIFVDGGADLLAAQELVREQQGLVRDLRTIEALELDVFAPGSLIEPMLIEARKVVQKKEDELYKEADAALTRIAEEDKLYEEANAELTRLAEEKEAAIASAKETYVAYSGITDSTTRRMMSGDFAFTTKSKHEDLPLLLFSEGGSARLVTLLKKASASDATVTGGSFRRDPDDRRYFYIDRPLVRQVEAELKRIGLKRTVVNAPDLDDTAALSEALDARKLAVVKRSIRYIPMDSLLRESEPVREEMYHFVSEIEHSPENTAVLRELPGLIDQLASGEPIDFTGFCERALTADTNLSFANRRAVAAILERQEPFEGVLGAGGEVLDPVALRRILVSIKKDIKSMVNEQLNRFKEAVANSMENLKKLEARKQALIARHLERTGSRPRDRDLPEFFKEDAPCRLMLEDEERNKRYLALMERLASEHGLDMPTH